MTALRHVAGRTLRNLRRNRIEGVGHDFIGDVRSRLGLEVRTIFDVGAHIGLTAIEFSDEFPSAVVYAFEPHPGNFERMKLNLRGKPEAKLFNVGFGSEPGTLPFHFDPDHPSMARIAADGETEIEVDTVDRFCSVHGIAHIDFMKVDVEGHEIPVLQGAKQMLGDARISIIKLETAIDPDSPYHTQLWDLCAYLHPFGYRLFGFYDQWEFPPEPHIAKLRRFDAAFISPRLIDRRESVRR